MLNFNSQEWFTYIGNLAGKYYECSEKNYVSYNKGLIDVIKNKYPARLLAIKNEIYGGGSHAENDDYAGNRIDRHKIAALYIQLFLENPLFALNIDTKSSTFPKWDTILINEAFCLEIIKAILTKWGGKVFDVDGFCREYRIFFLKLLYYYKKHSELNRVNSFFTHALAHLIYFIERDFCYRADPAIGRTP